MKINIKVIFAFAFLVIISVNARAQREGGDKCLKGEFHEKCYNASNSIFDDLIYLKSRPFSKDMSKDKYVVTLKKNTLYLFDICQGVKSKAALSLYYNNNEQDKIAGTLTADGRYNRVLSFYATVSGQYLISVDFEKSEEPCVVIVMGMIRKNIETYVKIPTE